MKLDKKRLVIALSAVMLTALTGCYAYTYYPYGYGYEAPYHRGYPGPDYGQGYRNGYGKQGYYGHDHHWQDNEEEDEDDRERRYGHYPGYPYGGYYGR